MNYFEAQALLSGVREGRVATIEAINKALELTGDLDESAWISSGRNRNGLEGKTKKGEGD